MVSKKDWRTWTIAGLLAAAGMGLPALAQGGGGGGGFDQNQMRQQMLSRVQQGILGRIQEEVGFTDEEWAVVGPKVWKVVSLQVDNGAGGLGGIMRSLRGFGMGGGGGGGGNANAIIAQIFNNGQPMLVTTKRDELQAAVDNPESSQQLLKSKLEEYRAAVSRSKEQMKLAQRDLEGVLTVRQEALLLQMGILD